MQLTTPFPLRSPIALIDVIKDIIKDKIVCDIGCGEGDILTLMKPHAAAVVGFELVEDKAQVAMSKGLDVVVGNYFIDRLPKAEVYYHWPDIPAHCFFICNRLKTEKPASTIIFGGRPNMPHLIQLAVENNGRVIEFPYKETMYINDFYPIFKPEGIFWALVINEKTSTNV